MTLLIGRGDGPSFPYAGRPMHVLAGHGDRPAGFAAAELAIPPHFAGPIPHAHDEFDEAIYVLSGGLTVLGEQGPRQAVAGSMFVAPRGHRSTITTPSAHAALRAGRQRRPSMPRPGHDHYPEGDRPGWALQCRA
jgi:hypothetical protein